MSFWAHCRRRLFGKRDAFSRQQWLHRPVLEYLEGRWLLSGGFTQVNLASDVPGLARITDPNLVNPWGISFSPTGPFWFADNGSGVSNLLDGRGQSVPLLVTMPFTTQSNGTPTGVVFNGGPGFLISENGVSAPSRFLFAAEDGTISSWTAVVDGTHALLAVDNSSLGAVYKGLALATDAAGRTFLYAANFGRGTIDVFDQNFKSVERSGSFQDPNLPQGYVPFNIQNIHDLLFVTYAQHDGVGRDDRAGAGHGFIDVYDAAGNLMRRFASRGALNSPWGLALAPADFGPFGGTLLVANNGDGHISAYDPESGTFLGSLTADDGSLITVPSLWALAFGNGHEGGASDTLFFTAGVDNEAHGLFGAIQAPLRKGTDTAGSGSFDPHAPGEPGDYPLPPSSGPALLDGNEDPVAVTAVLLPLTESSLALLPTLLTLPQQRTRFMPPVAAPAVNAVPFQGYDGTSLRSSNTAMFPPFPVHSLLPKNVKNSSAELNALFDLNPAHAWSEEQVSRQSPKIAADLVNTDYLAMDDDAAAHRVLAEPNLETLKAPSNAEHGLRWRPLSGRTQDVLAQAPSEDRSPSTADYTTKIQGPRRSDRWSWTRLLNGLLLVIGIAGVCALYRRPRASLIKLWDTYVNYGGAVVYQSEPLAELK
ncbi:MAG TPA: TIGR03118 family protein [Gemmataceae bacterium]|nr:TIGR03118 family protein [Gemmataceae bacterium]